MSLATRCPHCSTIFKVVQDQLKMSGGWVRCGRCSQPFNALETLFDMAHEAPPPRQEPSPTPAASPLFTPPPEATSDATPPGRLEDWVDADADPVLPPREAPGVTHFELDLPPAPDRVEAAMASLIASAPGPALQAPFPPPPPPASAEHLPATQEGDALDSRYLMSDPAGQRPAAVRRQRRGDPDFSDAEIPAEWHEDRLWNDTPDTTPAPPAHAHAQPVALAPSAHRLDAPDDLAPPAHAAADAPMAATAASASRPMPLESESGTRSQRRKIGEKAVDTAPDFIRQADRKALWHSPWMRGVLAGLSLALTLLLVLQVAIHHRDVLAERAPALAPALQRWCEQAGCQLGPVHDIEALQVESIAMIRASSEGPDVYRLVLNVRNHAARPRAWPSVDLTLTDANGGVLGRRLFDTRQAVLPPVGKTPAQPLPAAVPGGTVTTLQWRLQAPDLQLASYTVELFYP